MNVTRAQLLFLLLLGLAVFVPAIGTHDLWPADEPRYAQVAREMLESGDCLTLRINAEPYLEKPPLLFWAIAAVSKPFGDVSAISARIPSVVSALVVVALTYLFAARLYTPRLAFWSALVLMTANRFWWQATHAQIDMLVNNAGRSIRRSVALSYDRFHDYERTMQLNYFGTIRMIMGPVSYTHLRAHETVLELVCRLLLEKKKNRNNIRQQRI